MRGFFITPSRHPLLRCFNGLMAALLTASFILTPITVQAQSVIPSLLNLPVPGAMVQLSPAFTPVLLRGMTVHTDDPFKFDFIIDGGSTEFNTGQVKQESDKLVKYFLAAMTVPKDDLWVNLSPYEPGRIIPDELGKTALGRDMLAQDYILKQLTASLMYPEKELGKTFWDKVYQKARERFGTTEIPVDTFNKVWILPATAEVYEHGETVYIVEAKLKVMLDTDYMATREEVKDKRPITEDPSAAAGGGSSVAGLQSSVSKEIIKEIIIPAIEKEVNEGANFAPLRQIYHSLILAKWYKETVKNSLLSQVYIDKNKIAGVESGDAAVKDQIYARYMEAYAKGVFNYIKEDYDRLSREVIPRKYFSGGELFTQNIITRDARASGRIESSGPVYQALVTMVPDNKKMKIFRSMFKRYLEMLDRDNKLDVIKAIKYLELLFGKEVKERVGAENPRDKFQSEIKLLIPLLGHKLGMVSFFASVVNLTLLYIW
jgi:hypothetical protein